MQRPFFSQSPNRVGSGWGFISPTLPARFSKLDLGSFAFGTAFTAALPYLLDTVEGTTVF